MPQFTTKRRVRHSAADMFDLVADVERYPEFVPLCANLKVRERTTSGEGIETIVADMTVSFKLVRESFRSRVTLDRPKLQILVEYLQGPFSHMRNRWSFKPLGEAACEIEFYIDYEFRSRMLGVLMGGMFDVAFRRFAA
ncbi:MAG: type II toxin-antitoxin system RatA family toxin, partial [Hyphomicrobiales bacterium]